MSTGLKAGGPGSLTKSISTLVVVLVGLGLAAFPGVAQSVEHLIITQPGGMPGLPVMTGSETVSNGVVLHWDGPAGYYRVYWAGDLVSGHWQTVGSPNLDRTVTITSIYSNAFFRVSGPAPHYAGSQVCTECHEGIHATEMDTKHAGALQTLQAIGQQNNASCLPCHTVGFGLPSGFTSAAATPQLAGVQCENCHGPAANHAANPDDLTVVPRVEIAATVCGGCHTGAQHPTYEEWHGSLHAGVVEDMNPSSRISSCGRCHSGASRLSLLKNEALPTGDANMGIVCTTCHDPHGEHVFTNAITGTVYTNQLRNPLSSTNDYFLTTSDIFTNKYDPNINVCAQCHNHRGADWTSSSRPPHHSPQYNMLLSTVGLLPAGTAAYPPAAHGLLEKQCVTCHMQTAAGSGESVPAVTGHSFKVEMYNACTQCHSSPQLLVSFVTGSISNQVQQVKTYLDLWATTKAPEALRTKYGTLAWEYTTPGELSTGTAGPSSAEQAQIPDNIKKARFNLYIVLNDGSYGVHNGPYAVALLDAARNWVQQELNQ